MNININYTDKNTTNNYNACKDSILNENLLTEKLKKFSTLCDNEICNIINYLKNEHSKLLNQVTLLQKDIHLRPEKTGLPVPIEITKDKVGIIALKNWGKILGKGNFRSTKQAIILKDDYPLVADGTQELLDTRTKIHADGELKILNRLAEEQKQNPELKGILKYYLNVDYHSKINSVNINTSFNSSSGYYDSVSNEPPNDYQNDQTTLNQSPSIKASQIEKRSILTKFYNGGTLENCIDKLTLDERIFVAKKLFQALTDLHKMRIFHGDIKAENIFIERDPQGKIIEVVIGDFGCACDFTDPQDWYYKMGDKNVRSPEILNMKSGTPINQSILSSDVYAMGLIMDRMFSIYKKPQELDHLFTTMRSDKKFRPSAEEASEIFERTVILETNEQPDNKICFNPAPGAYF